MRTVWATGNSVAGMVGSGKGAQYSSLRVESTLVFAEQPADPREVHPWWPGCPRAVLGEKSPSHLNGTRTPDLLHG